MASSDAEQIAVLRRMTKCWDNVTEQLKRIADEVCELRVESGRQSSYMAETIMNQGRLNRERLGHELNCLAREAVQNESLHEVVERELSDKLDKMT